MGGEPQEGTARVSRTGPEREAHSAQASEADATATARVDGAQPRVDFASDVTAAGQRFRVLA
jgi:hypothetical protein